MMKTSKVFFFGFVFLFLLTTTAYRLWLDRQDLLVLGEESPARTEIRVVLAAPEGKRLVPEGAIFAADEVDEVVYSYEVDLPADESLSAAVADVELRRDGIASADVYGLLRFDVEVTRTEPSRATVTVRVSLSMPSTEAEYEAIAGASVRFTVVFERRAV